MSGQSRGAPMKVLDDRTSLDGDSIDVMARVGWLLRMARLSAGNGSVDGLAQMSSRLGEEGCPVSVTTLHRVESGQARLGHVTSAYEQVLGLAPGQLRAPVDIVCRTFPDSPPDKGTDPLPASVEEMSRLWENVHGQPTGGEWLAWARALAGVGGLGAPGSLVGERVQQLASEMGRAHGTGYHSRYEALALLRCSDYGGVVLEVARAMVADPHIQVLYDLMSLVGEAVTPDAVEWASRMLLDDRDRVVRGATIALENMAAVSGDPRVVGARPDLVLAAFARSSPGSERWATLSALVRLMPRAQRDRLRRELGQPLSPTVRIKQWGRTRVNEHWTLCERLARPITEQRGLGEQPLLARMIFEIAIGPAETRAVTSYMLLRALPWLGDGACDVVARLADAHPDPLVRKRAGRRLVGLADRVFPEVAQGWLAPDHEHNGVALLMAGAVRHQLPEEVLRPAVARENTAREALYAAGMTGSDLLYGLLADAETPPHVRGAIGWWQAHGTVVQD